MTGAQHCSGRKPVFSEQEENELEAVIKDMAQRGFPLTENNIRDLAHQYAARNGVEGLSSKNGQAGWYWLKGFLRRHPTISVKSPEALSSYRASGMNKQVVEKWFEDYKSLLESKGIIDVPSHIWNLDESGIQDTFRPKHAVGEKGVPLYQIQHAEKGETTTIVPIFNAMGVFGPLLVVFKGKRIKSEWLTNVPENVMIKCSDDGWINKGLFLEFGKRFVSWLPTEDKRPHVLLMDGHGSHVFNLDFLSLMKANNIEVFCFPAHTTHWLQPADKAVFKTFKTEWVKAGLEFNKETAGRKPSKAEFIQLFKNAWEKAATVEVVQGGFRGTGMFPWNPNAIPSVAYCASATTERLYNVSAEMPGSAEPQSSVEQQVSVEPQMEPQVSVEPQMEPHSSVEPQVSVEPQASATKRKITFSVLSPLPVKERTTKRKRRQTAYHLTGPQHTQYLEDIEKQKTSGRTRTTSTRSKKSGRIHNPQNY